MFRLLGLTWVRLALTRGDGFRFVEGAEDCYIPRTPAIRKDVDWHLIGNCE